MKKTIALLLASLMLLCVSSAMAEAPMVGGWAIADQNEISEEQKAVFDKALDGLVGVSYEPIEPIAYLGNQLVAGMNHCFLCKATVVYPNATPTLVLLYVYEDLSGNATITNIANLDIAALSAPVIAAE